MVAGPEVARVIVEFEDFNMHPRNQEETRHHEEIPSVQNTFARDVAVIEELGNPFEEDSQDLLVLDTKEIADPAVIETVVTRSRLAKTSLKHSQRNASWTEPSPLRRQSTGTSYHCLRPRKDPKYPKEINRSNL